MGRSRIPAANEIFLIDCPRCGRVLSLRYPPEVLRVPSEQIPGCHMVVNGETGAIVRMGKPL